MFKHKKLKDKKKSQIINEQSDKKTKQFNSGMILKSDSQNTKEIEIGLKKIYEDESGKIPKMTGLEYKKRNKFLRIIISIILVLAVLFSVSFAGFLLFQPKPKFTGNNVNLEIKAPFNANAGERITYQIAYTNLEDISLTNSQLDIYLPEGFIIEKSSQKFEAFADKNEKEIISNVRTLKINDLFPNQTNTLTIEGELIGTPDNKQIISATLSFVPANFSSEFQKTTSFTTDIAGSLAELSIESASQIAVQEDFETVIRIKNTSEEQNLKNAKLEFNYPQEFQLKKLQIIDLLTDEESSTTFQAPEPEDEIITEQIWQFDSLEPETEKEITITGSLNSEETKTFELKTKLSLKGVNEDFVQAEQVAEVEAIKGELIANLIIDGSNKNQAVNFGDTLNYLINIKNKSKTALGDLKIRAVLNSDLLNWETIKDNNDGMREGNQILWTKDQIENLRLLLPEEELEISLQINLNDYEKNKYDSTDLKVTSFFETQINKIDNTETNIEIESNTIINELNSNLELSAKGRYFDDNNNTIGSGPLPPIVNQTTKYVIFWDLTNSLHELKDITVSAKLPNHVDFVNNNNTSTGSLYKNNNNEIVWEIGRIPTSVNQATAQFEISITPQDDDVHKILTLLPEIQITATDTVSQGNIKKTYKGITTDLEEDPQATGKGLVQEKE